jgi:hypothetical protein
MIVTVTFDEQGGRTTLTIHTLFASVAMKNLHVGGGFVEGVGSGLDQLAELAAELRPGHGPCSYSEVECP